MEIKDMRLLGFSFSQLNAQKNPDFKGKLEVKQNINIDSIEKHKPELAKQDTLKIKFGYDVSYGDYGNIKLKGTMFLSLNQKALKQVLKQWEQRKLERDFNVVAFNIIFQKASLKALQLEEELGLPPHVQLPRFQLSEQQTQQSQQSKSSKNK